MKVSDEKLNRFISKHMLDYRLRHSLSQEGMAEQLNIAPRCYLEQENGRCGFSGQTVCHFISVLSDKEAFAFISDLRSVWDEDKPST